MLTRVPQTTESEFKDAVDAASQAFKTWSRTSVVTRQKFAIEYVATYCRVCPVIDQHFPRLQHLLRQNAEYIANSIVLEQGKTLAGIVCCFGTPVLFS